jgi:hypothetical protein
MVEIETVLLPITFGSGRSERYIGVAQVLTDVSSISGRAISFERLVASALVREDEDVATAELPPPPAPPISRDNSWRQHSRAPHLRLIVSRNNAFAAPDPLRDDAQETLRKIFTLCGSAVSQRAQ